MHPRLALTPVCNKLWRSHQGTRRKVSRKDKIEIPEVSIKSDSRRAFIPTLVQQRNWRRWRNAAGASGLRRSSLYSLTWANALLVRLVSTKGFRRHKRLGTL